MVSSVLLRDGEAAGLELLRVEAAIAQSLHHFIPSCLSDCAPRYTQLHEIAAAQMSDTTPIQ
jgi:hypothetical protein